MKNWIRNYLPIYTIKLSF